VCDTATGMLNSKEVKQRLGVGTAAFQKCDPGVDRFPPG
jgi:hypothetical protein